MRTGPPSDSDADMNGPHWAGVIPVALTSFPPVPASDLAPHVAMPRHIKEFHHVPPASRLATKFAGNSSTGAGLGVSAGAVLVYIVLVVVALLARRPLEPYIGRW